MREFELRPRIHGGGEADGGWQDYLHYDAMTAMMESWREELYTMNVKNSILLDDLVILGADS
jgi:hypothetical protein